MRAGIITIMSCVGCAMQNPEFVTVSPPLKLRQSSCRYPCLCAMRRYATFCAAAEAGDQALAATCYQQFVRDLSAFQFQARSPELIAAG